MYNIYKKYKERLVEISGKNRSLYSKKIGKQYAYDIGKILKKDTKNTNLLYEFLMKNKRTGFTLISKDSRPFLLDALNLNEKIEKKFQTKTPKSNVDARSENLRRERIKKEEIKKANISQVNNLRTLKREVDEFVKETGRYEMFVGYPFVQGELNKDTMIKGPLILFPVTINIIDEFTVDLEFKRDEPIQLNKVFILAYAKQHKLVIDDLIQEFDINNRFNFQSVKEVIDYLNGFGFKLKYSERASLETFEDGGEPHRGDKLTIRNYAVIGRFPLANSIYNDYDALEKSKLSTSAIDMLLGNKEMPKSKVTIKDEFPITESDFAQHNSLDEINKSGNVVIFGPPGTGKSQSIVNIISDSISKGKKVLVISQKKVAMDVVYNRLGTVANKTMYLVDINKGLSMFYDKVKRIHNEVLASSENDEIIKHEKLTQNIQEEVKHLEELSTALYERLEYGASLQELYITTPQIQKGTFEFKVYNKLLDNAEIMAFDYFRLKDITKKIYEKSQDKLFYKYNQMISKNPFIPSLKMDINITDQNALKQYLHKLVSSPLQPFNFNNYIELKPLLFMCLINPNLSEKDIDKFIKMIAKAKCVDNKNNFKETLTNLKEQFRHLQLDVDNFIGESELLQRALTSAGYSTIIDNILSGNSATILLLNDALKNYSVIKDIKQNLDVLTDNDRIILNFALENAQSEDEIRTIVSKLLLIRNYHEIVKAEEKQDKKLSFILDFENTKQRIINLKTELLEINKNIAYNSFNKTYIDFYNSSKDNKDYLYVINKQENMWSIRKTMEYFSDYLLRLFPCWMMSPENVSSIIPLKQNLFDVVIFDEASQIFIENSIPAIYRGQCVAIAGDRKQLRPTTTFMKRYIGNENFEDMSLTEQAALEVESLLDLATSRYSNANLTYHYRSKYEELINFSNYAFYDEKLQIAPNISKNVHKPIERIKVNGVWNDRRNHEEAVEVVKTIKKIFKTRLNNETIGVITFNTEQEHYIEDIIDIECQKDPEFREQYLTECNRKENGEDTGLFIKNIENVQGEERDIIIFSIGYAKNERGKVVAQFGALSMEGGENRLNVAITRAKEKIYLITSIEPEDLNVAYSKNLGPKILKKYLQYVRAVSFDNKYEQKIILESLRKKTIIEEHSTEGIEEEIKKALTKKKYIVDTNIGNAKYKINLGIYNKKLDRYVLGIEIDSSAYNASESLLERDVYRTNFLNSRGWNIMRLWSRDWWTNKENTIELIESKIAKATEKIIQEKALEKKRKSKKSTTTPAQKQENPLANNIFEKAPEETKVISTRLSKKALARLEQDQENATQIDEEIKKINENSDYVLVLDPELPEETKSKKSRKSKSKDVNTADEKVESEQVGNQTTSEKPEKDQKVTIDGVEYLDEVQAKYENKKLKKAIRKNKKLDKKLERIEKQEEAKKQKQIDIENRRIAKEQARQQKEIERQEKLKEKHLKKKYSNRQISKAKDQLSNLTKISSMKKATKKTEEKVDDTKETKTPTPKDKNTDLKAIRDLIAKKQSENKSSQKETNVAKNSLTETKSNETKTMKNQKSPTQPKAKVAKSKKSETKENVEQLSMDLDANTKQSSNNLQSLISKLKNKDK